MDGWMDGAEPISFPGSLIFPGGEMRDPGKEVGAEHLSKGFYKAFSFSIVFGPKRHLSVLEAKILSKLGELATLKGEPLSDFTTWVTPNMRQICGPA